jgi:phenylpropionate dioxygenase-like ring-hydroxylating dioxygenase large terminal subunit
MISTTDTLCESLDSGATLPADWYVDAEVLRAEQERIFATSWQYVGRTDQLNQPGDYITATVGTVPVVVARHPDGTLRGFVNICRHRCAEVVTAPGRRNVLQCHYHAWSYDLDGHLVSAPRSDCEPDFDPTRFSLLPVEVGTWEPFVFVNVGSDPIPLRDHLGELPRLMERDGLDPAVVTFRQHGEWSVAANWKVVVENFGECYHCPVAHPSFSRLMEVDPDDYHLEVGPWWSRAVTSLRPSALRPDANVPYPPSGPLERGQFGFVWPNFTIVQNPGPPNLMAFWFVPTGPEQTNVVMDYWFAPDLDEELVRAIVDFNVVVGMEDQKLVESVQRGLRSGRVAQGQLLLDSERLIQHFQRLVYQSLGT